jgi:PilZ domain
LKFEKITVDGNCTRDDKRRESVTLLCEVRQGTRPWQKVRLEEISQTGFRIAWLPGASVDKPLRIRIPGIQLLTAQVRWNRGAAIGCEFAAPLHVAVFEHIVTQSG